MCNYKIILICSAENEQLKAEELQLVDQLRQHESEITELNSR